MHIRSFVIILTALLVAPAAVAADNGPAREQALTTLRKAVKFFHGKVASNGGYVWRYSSDLKYRQGEGLAYDQRIWVQPPGTPAVGLAFLDAFQVTGDSSHLQAARDVAEALVKGQLHSGGWHYSITFDPQKRTAYNYRIGPTKGKPNVRIKLSEPGGWAVWRQRRHKGNITIVDDDVTPAALRLLMRVDKVLNFKVKEIHEAAEFGLASLLKTQYPVGAWSHNYDRFPRKTPSEEYYPLKKASFPKEWSRMWTRKFNGCYLINDRITLNVIETMLDAHKIYGKKRHLDSALKGGDFLLRSQMPEPQPAWAQQYDRHLQPVWDRPFEPPAITGLESQDVLETLLRLYKQTGQRQYLDAVAKALKYLQRSTLKDGKLARFYELKTNRPLYFTTNYKLTYDRGKMPKHYAFVVESRLDAIARHYQRLKKHGPKAKTPFPNRTALAKQVQQIISGMDKRGAWTEPGWVRNPQGRKVVPADGILRSETFIKNVQVLCRFIQTTTDKLKR